MQNNVNKTIIIIVCEISISKGMPRTGNKAYADFLNSHKEICVTRVVNNGDVVPHLNLAKFGTIHHGIVIEFLEMVEILLILCR